MGKNTKEPKNDQFQSRKNLHVMGKNEYLIILISDTLSAKFQARNLAPLSRKMENADILEF